MKYQKPIALFLTYSIWIGVFAPLTAAQNRNKTDAPDSGQAEIKGLQFRVREGEKPPKQADNSRPSNALKLNDSETDAVLRRLPPMPFDEAEKSDFAVRANSLPPPKAGKTIPVKFPADENQAVPKPEISDSSALEVVRFAPSGDVSLAPDLSVTFSQPMVAVGALNEQTNEEVPVELTPNIKGRWRWLGTKTLIFDAETRFPMATTFTATIRAGTKSATGGILPKDVFWTFSTPPPKVEKFLPSGQTVRNDALMLAVFNQDINPEAVLANTNALNFKTKIPLRLAAADEIAANEDIVKATKDLPPHRWLAFRAVDALPPDALIIVDFQPGTPSAEGNLTTVEQQFFSFKTFGSLKFDKSFCGYDQSEITCSSYQEWNIRFNNPLDEKTFDKSQIKIEPNIKNAKISADGNTIEISGYKQKRRRYKATVAGSLKDIFGQTLEKDVSTFFEVSADEPELSSRGGDFVTLDPNGKPEFAVYSTNYSNLTVKLYAVQAEDYPAFKKFREDNEKKIPAIGKIVYEKPVKIKSAPDESVETKINLLPALTKGSGQMILTVEAPYTDAKPIVQWLQKTNIGVDAFADYEKLTVFTSDLKSGKSLPDAQIKLSSGEIGTSAKNGLTQIKLPANDDKGAWLIASHGSDTAILSGNEYRNNESWSDGSGKGDVRWFVFDDRQMYRPGETVSVKGYIRKITGGLTADVAELADAAGNLTYILKDSLDNQISKGTVKINAFGAFDLKLTLPKNINLGSQQIEFKTGSKLETSEYTHSFRVEEFRRPEFEVSTSVEDAAPFYVGDSARLRTEAKYFSGGFLSNAATVWNVTAEPTNYTPPNRENYTFGKFIPWWRYSPDDRDAKTSQTFNGTTGADGSHRVALDFTAANPARPYTVTAEAKVQDVNRQTFAASTVLLVHPSELYVGISAAKTFVRKDEKFAVETITTDVDGKAIAGAPVLIKAELNDWQKIKGEWQQVTIDTQTCRINSADAPVSCDITAKEGGTYTITANVFDRRGRRNESELTIWVAGGNIEPTNEVEQEEATLIPDKKEYAPNDTAEILVNSPFVPAEGVLTLRRNGIVKAERFTMNESSTVLRIPIKESYLPNLHISVDLVGTSPRVLYDDERDAKVPKRPAFAVGELNLEVSTASRRLNVTAEPLARTLEPGGETTLNIAVKDSQGNPAANTEVAVVAVDESVLALTNYKIADPLDVFYPQIETETSDYHSRANIQLSYPDDIGFGSGNGSGNGYGNGNGGGGGGGRESDSPFRRLEILTSLQRPPEVKFDSPDQIRLRSNFDALAIFAPSVKTDADGRAIVNLKLPDNLTRYRITAVAATDSKQFGSGESNITARQSLMARPSAPRFMNFGDKFELPVVLQNQTDAAMTVDVAVRASNAVLTEGGGRRITIEPNDRAEIRFPVTTEKAGTARFQVTAVSGKLADAAEFEFPVYTPATSESFAAYGTTDANGAIAQKISLPKDVFSEFGGLKISTASTQLQELTDAFVYLQNYPFECSEQISSRVLAVAALRDVLTAFNSKALPEKSVIEAKMRTDIERLVKLQHRDGGFSFWRSDDESVPYLSVHVAHALIRAKAKGYDVPPDAISKSLAYLKNIEAQYKNYYSQKSRRAISAYALDVRALSGDQDFEKARKLLAEATLENLSPEAVGWILSVLAEDKNSAAQVEEIKRYLLNRATETAGAAHFVTDYEDGEYVLLSSARRADGVILESLLKADPTNDLIPKIVRGLLAGKTRGAWANTQENAFILLALDKYFQTYEKVTPDFVTRIWLGDAYAGERKFAGRTGETNLISVPMNYLQRQSNADLILDKQGAGRLYYRIGLNYAPKNLILNSTDEGFTVSRRYAAVDDENDVKRDADGTWLIKSGARVRIQIQMLAPTRRYHVALVDKLPAGLEIINSELANSETLSPDKVNDNDIYNRQWFEHQNLRDDRAEVFTTLLKEGVWNYSYTTRATTPGNYIVPPAKAEEMYAPETFGRTATDFVKVY